MTFLRLLSEEVFQNFTYTCINSAAWYNAVSNDYQQSIKLRGDNDEIMSYSSFRPNVIFDDCKVR